MGNPDLDFEIRIWDFAFEREIRNRVSLFRNPSSGWFSIKESKSGFHGFPSLPYDWEIRKRICKTILLNGGLLFANYGCACKTAVLENSFSNSFSDFPKNWKERKSKHRYPSIEIRFRISRSIANPKSVF